MDPDQLQPFSPAQPLYKVWLERLVTGLREQTILFQALLVALTLHVIMFPILWFIGWALPWPKSPVITTVIEFDLQNWLKSGKPKSIIEFRDPNLNK